MVGCLYSYYSTGSEYFILYCMFVFQTELNPMRHINFESHHADPQSQRGGTSRNIFYFKEGFSFSSDE